MTQIMTKMKSWLSLLPPFTINNVIEVIILAFFIYECMLWIKNTRAWALLRGILVIVVFTFMAFILQLSTIVWLIERFASIAIIAAVVIFQPEIRRALEQLGTRSFIAGILPTERTERSSALTVDEIIKATFEMAKKKTGALIVIQQRQPLKEIEDTGIRIDGIVTSALLINIFEKIHRFMMERWLLSVIRSPQLRAICHCLIQKFLRILVQGIVQHLVFPK